ncbi:MAG: type II toxin-antitoxin system HicB family antitoxin [Sphaerochaeta sp.]|nr:toxin-antitoxin system HicB family antitoxin [Sphaerochaeta sp.]
MKKIEDYLKLPYTLELTKEEDGSYFISVKELDGCFSVGDTAVEALEMIEDAKKTWISFSLEKGLPIPEPESMDSKSYSGRFVVRVTPSLHRMLSLQAKSNGVSLNHHVTEILSGKCSIIETLNKIIGSFAASRERQFTKSLTSGAGRLEHQNESQKVAWKSQANVMDFPNRKRM